ncbi:hypothetical protein [Falsiroseomonas sp. E2-1-a20]|uniref:hypothetical protein n=1 Tax=Falsiroseomonas sp. E2-1-a20 TaxID=3239300 RepID=UPI003F2EB0C0
MAPGSSSTRKGERLVRKDIGRKLDAKRTRRHDVILHLIAEEAEAGRLCTTNAFASKFENNRGLGGKDTIRDRITVLSTKGYIKFRRDARDLGQPYTRSKNGYLVVKDMVVATDEEVIDAETGEVTQATLPVLPSHFLCPRSEALLRSRTRKCGCCTTPRRAANDPLISPSQ